MQFALVSLCKRMGIMNSLKVLGKYLDQPRLVKRFSRAVPFVLVAGGGLYTYEHIKKTSQSEKKKELTKSIAVLAGTVISAIAAPKIAAKIFKEAHAHEHCHHHHETGELIISFLKNNKVTPKTSEILNKAKEKILRPKEIRRVFEELGQNPKGKEFLSGEEGLIPDPENIDSKHIFGEIGRLSVFGLIPVLGGIAGGVIGDKLSEKNWRERIPDKIKEGTYQYLANIVLCNIGAGVALWGLESAKITSKPARALGMLTGIVLAGLVFGSAIANFIGKFCIDPLFHPKDKNRVHRHVDLYSERKPEILDAGLHVDDVSVVAVLSGLKWIEPALPILYAISGYRAGIGYRNGENVKSEA
jgi:hypothetical protein